MGLLEIRSWRFLAPVLIGDTIHIVNEVTELRPTSKSDRGVMVPGSKSSSRTRRLRHRATSSCCFADAEAPHPREKACGV